MPFIDRKWFLEDAVTLAPALLGAVLVHQSPSGETAGIIVETEAYRQDDAASHSFRGKSARNAVMFGPAGRAYVYFTYGMHHCCNVVCGNGTMAQAVLIRALQPTEGIGLMAARRGTGRLTNLCSGPAKLTQAMGIIAAHNGISLLSPPLFITPGSLPADVAISPRIGITKAMDRPWRFFIPGNPHVTPHRFNRNHV